MLWTAISYNWSAVLTSVNTFDAPFDHDVAVLHFKEKFIGENLLALIPGDHEEKAITFPLLNPDFKPRSNND